MGGSIFPLMRLRRSATHGFFAWRAVSLIKSFCSCLSFDFFFFLENIARHLLSPQMKEAVRKAQMSTAVTICVRVHAVLTPVH